MRGKGKRDDAPVTLTIDELPAAAILLDSSGRLVQANQHAAAMFESKPEHLIGTSAVDLLGRDLLWCSHGTATTFDVNIALSGGRTTPVVAHATTQFNGVAAARTTVILTPGQRPVDRADHAPSVVSWSEVAESLTDPENYVTCAIFGLVGLRAINDGFSRSSGDFVLAEIARRLSGFCASRTSVARIAGSRFLVIMPASPDVERTLALAIAGITRPIETPLGPAAVGCAAGAVSGPSRSPLLLIDKADRNLDEALAEGAGTIVWRNGGEPRTRPATARLAAPLLEGLTDGSITAEFHPVSDVNGSVLEYKAVACWVDASGTRRTNDEFAALAVDLGVNTDIGWIVVRGALDLCADLAEREPNSLTRVSVDIGATELCRAGFAERLEEQIGALSIRRGMLQFDVTGGVAPHQIERLSDTIAVLRQLGVRTRVDHTVRRIPEVGVACAAPRDTKHRHGGMVRTNVHVSDRISRLRPGFELGAKNGSKRSARGTD